MDIGELTIKGYIKRLDYKVIIQLLEYLFQCSMSTAIDYIINFRFKNTSKFMNRAKTFFIKLKGKSSFLVSLSIYFGSIKCICISKY